MCVDNISTLRQRSPRPWGPAPWHNLPYSDTGRPRSPEEPMPQCTSGDSSRVERASPAERHTMLACFCRQPASGPAGRSSDALSGRASAASPFKAEPGVGTDGDTMWIAAGWRSEATGPDGRPFIRLGRATLILARRVGRWLYVHSHISLQPTQPESAHGDLRAQARNSFATFSVSLPTDASPRLGKRGNRPSAPQKTITPRPTASESRSSYARSMSARP